MFHSKKKILLILEECRERFAFPAMDNGYVYPAATRLSVFRSKVDWAITIEVFGFSPRNGIPNTCVYSLGSSIVHHETQKDYANKESYENFLYRNIHNAMNFFYPFDLEIERDAENEEIISSDLKEVFVRGKKIALPSRSCYIEAGIELIDIERIYVFELCRWLSKSFRAIFMATNSELRSNLPIDLELLLQVDDWNHPDILGDDVRISDNETFMQIATVLEKNNPKYYSPKLRPNTDWINWPKAGIL